MSSDEHQLNELRQYIEKLEEENRDLKDELKDVKNRLNKQIS